MPYVVVRGEVHMDGQIYRLGDEVPAMKGTLSDVVAVGAIEWRDSRKEQGKSKRRAGLK